jgi:hypothetical protein
MAATFHNNFQVDWTRAVCVVRPCDWDETLTEWGKKVAAAKDAAVKKYGRWDGHFYADIPSPPPGYFDNDVDNHFLHKAIVAAWRTFGALA